MPDYKKMYLAMVSAAEDVVCLLEKSEPTSSDWPLFMKIAKRLTDAQLKCEDIYINQD